MTKQLKWRLGKLPTPDEVLKLVNDKLITKEEAREILFKEELEEDIKTEDLKQEIKFLRELVDKLSSKSQVIEVIREIEKPYYQWGWYQPYVTWCGTTTANTIGPTTDGGNTLYLSDSSVITGTVNCSFTDVKTF